MHDAHKQPGVAPVNEQKLKRDRFAAYKALAQTKLGRDDRIDQLVKLAVEIGWEPPEQFHERAIPTFPFVFEWSEEGRYEVRPCRWAGGRRALWQPHRPGIGRPLSGIHKVRLRRAVVEDLCMVCGQEIDTSDVLWLNIEDLVSPAADGWENLLRPHLHLECIRHSLDGCPHLRAGFSGFAPYKGPIRKRTFAFSAEGLEEFCGLKTAPGALTVGAVNYQIPAAEMAKLRSIAVSPAGFSWRNRETTTF